MSRPPSWPWTLGAFAAGAGVVILTLWLDIQLRPVDCPQATAGRDGGPGREPVVSYATAVSRAAPAVVNIYSTKVATERESLAFRDPYLQQQFGRFLPEFTRRRHYTSLGSGVILSRDGLILTNRHIIKGAQEIKVVLADGRSMDVGVVGVDPETDLAVLKGSAKGLPTIPLGRPKDLRVGDVLLAIGDPFGIGQTVTMGIVSATGRTKLGISNIENFIQTDAAINPGNSGGALINAQGELVGINSAIYSQSGGSEGIGFAIPTDLASRVAGQLVRKGRVARGWVGVVARSVTPQLADAFGLRVPHGVLVTSTAENSPAEHAGVRAGDVITRVGDHPVASTEDLLEGVAEAGPGANVQIELWRGSKRIETRATTVERPLVAKQ
ncbi:MAG: trypsin-like peptidase domain-containing protein [Chromatiaceae bacterium]